MRRRCSSTWTALQLPSVLRPDVRITVWDSRVPWTTSAVAVAAKRDRPDRRGLRLVDSGHEEPLTPRRKATRGRPDCAVHFAEVRCRCPEMPLASLSGAAGNRDVTEGERIRTDQAFGLLRRTPSTSISSRGKWPRTSSKRVGCSRVNFCDRMDFALEQVDDPNVAL
jgi:hypothetical protein